MSIFVLEKQANGYHPVLVRAYVLSAIVYPIVFFEREYEFDLNRYKVGPITVRSLEFELKVSNY